MKELKCPKCGNIFQVDEADYASIVNQVKNAEFNAEINRRMDEIHERNKTEGQLMAAQMEKQFQIELSSKDKALFDSANIIAQLQEKLKTIEEKNAVELSLALAGKDKEIAALQSSVNEGENKLKIAVMEEQQKSLERIKLKDDEITQLKINVELEKTQATNKANSIKEQFKEKLKLAKEQIDYYKDMKLRMSTKMIGETLEIHCSSQYNQMIRPIMPNAYFEKDNDASGGSKGDFIFRDFADDGTEYVSIMFEMKNEADETASKHKNEDFFKKLDSDRRAKGCEFAVLVSLLEPENEIYNAGIVDVSNRYNKMYVIRPQFFLPIISLLVQTSKKKFGIQTAIGCGSKPVYRCDQFRKPTTRFSRKIR